jgi:hypothetical protein
LLLSTDALEADNNPDAVFDLIDTGIPTPLRKQGHVVIVKHMLHVRRTSFWIYPPTHNDFHNCFYGSLGLNAKPLLRR